MARRAYNDPNRFKADDQGNPYVYRSVKRYDVEQRPGESELQYYRRLAKAADQRLVRLEALSHDPQFKGARKMAYATALEDISKYGKGKRFNTAPPEDRRFFVEKIMDMRYFLTSPTSTKQGIIETYQRRADKLNKDFPGLDFTWKDLAEYFDTGASSRAERTAGESRTALRAIAMIKLERVKLANKIASNKNVKMDAPDIDAAIALLNNKTVPGMLGLSEKERSRIKASLKGRA